jgi:hypothetical protein
MVPSRSVLDGRKLERYRTTIDFDVSRRVLDCAGSETTHFWTVGATAW